MNKLQKIKNIDIKKVVLEKIRNGAIKKHSKLYFVIKNIFLVSAIILIFFVLLFTISFIFFSLKASELWSLPVFGLKGIIILLANFPWLLALIVLIFIAILELLVNRFEFVFLRPLFYSALVIIFLVTTASLLIDDTPLHESIYVKAKQGELSILKPFYDKYTKPTPINFHPGTVVEKNGDDFTIELADKTIIKVNISNSTKIRPGFEIYKGGRLLIIGEIKDEILEAEAIDNAPSHGRP